MELFRVGSGRVGWGRSNSDYKAISVQLQLQLPAGTELGNNTVKIALGSKPFDLFAVIVAVSNALSQNAINKSYKYNRTGNIRNQQMITLFMKSYLTQLGKVLTLSQLFD